MEDKLIWCDTKEKLSKVIEKLQKDGYSTPSVDWMWQSYGNETTLRVNDSYKSASFASKSWYKKNDYGDAITANKFLGEKERPSIVIFRRYRNVIAKNTATGDEGVAKCSPNDDFCFKTGASIAMARLMAKTPEVLTDDVKAEWKKVLGIEDIPARVDKWDESKIHEGDTVKVINTGLNYSSYVQWVGEHISDPYMAARFCFGSPNTDCKYKVIKIAEHERNHMPLAYIEEIGGLSYNKCYLIEVKGLEKV